MPTIPTTPTGPDAELDLELGDVERTGPAPAPEPGESSGWGDVPRPQPQQPKEGD